MKYCSSHFLCIQSNISSAVFFLNTLKVQRRKSTLMEATVKYCIQFGSSEWSQYYMSDMRETKSIQTMPDNLLSDKGQQRISRIWQKCSDIPWNAATKSHGLWSETFLDCSNTLHFITFKGFYFSCSFTPVFMHCSSS